MFLLLLKSLYFFLPAYIANMAPVFCAKIPWLQKPLWERKLGKNKTWRGLVCGTIAGGLVFWLQRLVHIAGFQQWSIIDYSDFSLLLGVLLGLGALVGDAVKSYYKRKARIAPGEPWMGFDQLDFVIGGIVLSWTVFVPPAEVVLTLLVVSPILHIVVNHIGYWIGMRQKKW